MPEQNMAPLPAQPQMPIVVLYDAMRAARRGDMPPFTTDSFIQQLGLDHDIPDRLTLVDRLVGETLVPSLIEGVKAMRSLVFLNRQIRHLLDVTNERSANPAQEAIAQCLGTVVVRQVTREKDICPVASSFALRSTRNDLIPDNIRRMLISEFE